MSAKIELDELLNGTPAWSDVQDYFQNGEFYEEHYLVEAIEVHLLTPEQKTQIHQAGLSIEKMLNGRYNSHEQGPLVHGIYAAWNEKLGFESFGS